MKSNFKKLTAITLSSLGILASAPSAFCTPKAKSSQSKIKKEKKPKKEIKTAKSPQKTATIELIIDEGIFSNGTTHSPNTEGNYLVAPYTEILSNSAFALNKKHEVVELPRICPSTFNYEENLEKNELPPNIHNVGPFAFNEKLKKVELPEIRHIGPFAFYKCTNLKEIVLGDELTEVSRTAFYGCHPDLKIVYRGKKFSYSEFFANNESLLISSTAPQRIEILELYKPFLFLPESSEYVYSMRLESNETSAKLIFYEELVPERQIKAKYQDQDQEPTIIESSIEE